MSDSEDEHVYGNTNTNARPELTQKKVRHVGGETREAELLMEERGEHEDRGEREERTVDIYVTADDLRPGSGTQQDAVPRSTAPQQQHGGGSGEPKNNRSRAAAVCLGLMCLLLSAGVIGLVVHNNNLVKHLDQLQTRHNMTGQKVTFEARLDELQTRCTNATEQNAKLQTTLDELQTTYTNATQDKVKLQTSWDELQSRYKDLKKRLCGLPGWQKSVYGCYFISTEMKTWEESRQYCRDNYSDLMVIKTEEEQDIVKDFNKRVWLGLTDGEEEGRFKWVDGTPLTKPTFWNMGQPNNKGLAGDREEDCVEFVNRPDKSRGWNDRACSVRNQWICEIVIY